MTECKHCGARFPETSAWQCRYCLGELRPRAFTLIGFNENTGKVWAERLRKAFDEWESASKLRDSQNR